MTVVGAYEPIDVTEQYWADFAYFDERPTDRHVTAPILAGRLTLESIEVAERTTKLWLPVEVAVLVGVHRLEGALPRPDFLVDHAPRGGGWMQPQVTAHVRVAEPRALEERGGPDHPGP